MDTYTDLCQSFGVPLWVGPLMHAAARKRNTDRIKRRRVYRLIQRHLMINRVGCRKHAKPTYVYPNVLKEMIREAFPKDICEYEDPCHANVVAITIDDLKRVELLIPGMD